VSLATFTFSPGKQGFSVEEVKYLERLLVCMRRMERMTEGQRDGGRIEGGRLGRRCKG
jgi:hypothetical protein